MFYTSLERTGAGYFDRYLLHNLGDSRTKLFEDYGMWEFTAGLKAQGLIRELGFSIHDKADALDRILTEHPEVDFVQLQINYADWEDPVVESRKCYETAVKHNKPVIIMEPVKGGNLADPPHGIRDIMEAAAPGASPSSWAIRFAASLEHADVVLSGMSNLEQLKDNISYMEDFQPLTAGEYAVIDRAREILKSIPTVPCTACRYCTDGCPMQINIPGVFMAYNSLMCYNNLEDAKDSYKFRTRTGGKASDCIACGACEGVCPQHIGIIEELKKAASKLE